MCKAPISSTATADPAIVNKDDTPPNQKIITKSELAQHNSPSSAWCAIHSLDSTGQVNKPHVVLDITKFAKSHPGGDLILLAAGKDATALFETYHPRGVPNSLIKKLTIGTMEKNAYNNSFYSWNSDFYKVLKKRVVKRLEERNLNRRGSYEIYIKAIILLLGFWYSLYKMYTTTTSFSIAIMWSISMGCFAAMIGTNIQHDGNHGAFSQSKLVNKVAGWTLDMIGASAFTWEIQHMLGHHPYTNVLDEVEESRKCGDGDGKDVKIEEKDQVCVCLFSCCVVLYVLFLDSSSHRPHPTSLSHHTTHIGI